MTSFYLFVAFVIITCCSSCVNVATGGSEISISSTVEGRTKVSADTPVENNK